jgi:nucleotide-binding universal stress UspA family protein
VRARRSQNGSAGYRRIVVPIVDDAASLRALDVACRLASERRASVIAVTVIEVPELLPLDAHMVEEEEDALKALVRASSVGEAYGVTVSPRILRARQAAVAIVEQARTAAAEVVVLGAPRTGLHKRHAPIFGRTVHDVLVRAACRVMVVSAPAEVAEPPAARRGWRR